MDISEFLQTRGGLTAFQKHFSAEQAARFIGQVFNGYQIESLIDEGGMAVVYKASRIDGSFERTAAVKVINPVLLSEELRLRFFVERQILASLTHPNIAQLYDAGVTEDGLPYLIMEYVEGLHLDEYCHTCSPPLSERLKLFRLIAEAVQYAHERQIIHRDIKPSNILIDPQGCPKLLDFGIAKVMDSPIASVQTQHTPLTFRYASPEQITGGDITVKSDIFQLGGILSYLLTGRPVYQGDTRADIIEAVGSYATPRPPSHYLKDPSHRYTGDYRAVKGDLDAIASKCLRLEPEERYASVELLREDLSRYRDGLTVSARAGAWEYQVSKFLVRNRSLVSATFAFLMVFLGTVLYNVVQLNQAKVQAEQEAEKANRVKQLVTNIFRTSSPYEAKTYQLSVEEILKRAQYQIDIDLRDEPEVATELYDVLGKLYTDLSDLQAAEAILTKNIDREHPNRFSAIDITYARLLSRLGKYDDSYRVIDNYIRYAETNEANADDLLSAYLVKAYLMTETNQVGNGLELLLSSINSLKSKIRNKQLLADGYVLLSKCYRFYKDFGSMLSYLEKAEDIYLKKYGEDYFGNIGIELQKAHAYLGKGDFDKTRKCLDKAKEKIGKFPTASNHDLASLYNGYYHLNFETGQYRNALEAIEKAIKLQLETSDKNSLEIVGLYYNKARLLEALGDFETSIRTKESVAEVLRAHNHSFLPSALESIALAYERLGNYEESKQYYDEAIAFKGESTPGDLSVPNIRASAARVLCRVKHFKRAGQYLEQAEAVFREAHATENEDIAHLVVSKAFCAYESGQWTQALAHFEKAQSLFTEIQGPDSKHVALAMLGQGKVHLKLGRPETARRLFENADGIYGKKFDSVHRLRIELAVWRTKLLLEEQRPREAQEQLAHIRSLLEKVSWQHREINQHMSSIDKQLIAHSQLAASQ